jgi:hypothetical protein
MELDEYNLNYDSEESIEICPFCRCINKPSQDQACIHFLGLYSDGEFHWGGDDIDILLDTIDSLRNHLAVNDHIIDIIDDVNRCQFLTEKQRHYCSILGPYSHDNDIDVLLDICGDSIKVGIVRETETFLSSGVGITYYIETLELLNSAEAELNILMELLVKYTEGS